MEPTVVTPAEPTTADVELKSFTTEERHSWRKTGELPQRDAQPKTQAPAPADTSKETISEDTKSESAPAPEAGKSQETHQRPRKPVAEQRIAELTAEIKRLKAAQQVQPTRTAEPSPAKPAEEPKAFEPPKKPEQKDFKSWEEYDAAKDKYQEDLADYKAQKAVRDFQAQQAQAEQQKKFNGEVAAARARYKDFDQAIQPVINAIVPDQSIAPVVKAALGNGEIAMDVMYVLGSDKAKLDAFVNVARTDPIQALEEVFLLRQLVRETLKGSSKSTPEKGLDGKFLSTTPEKQITKAPAPPSEVSGRGTPPADEVESALKSENVRGYMDAQNRRDLARNKAGRR